MIEHNDGRFLTNWYRGLFIGGGVVAAVAALLLIIIGTARSILRNATRAIDVANEIVANTRPIWDLERTNAVATQLLEGAGAIEQHATEVAEALEASHPAT